MLENTGDETLDLSNYTIQIAGGEDNHEFEETKLDPNAQLRLYIGSVTETIGLHSNKSESVLSNGGNAVTAKAEDSNTVDEEEI